MSLFSKLAEAPLDTGKQPKPKALGLADTLKEPGTEENVEVAPNPEMSKDKRTVAKQNQGVLKGIKQGTEAKGPVKLKGTLPNLGIRANSDPEVKEKKSRVDQILERLNQLPEARQNAQTRTEWAQLAEKVGHALTQIGAGMYGLKHGVDMSGVKFDKTDWASVLDKRLKILDTEMGQLERELGREVAQEETLRLEEREDKQRAEDKAHALKLAKLKAAQKKKKDGFNIAAFIADNDRLTQALEIFRDPDQKATGLWGQVPKSVRKAAAAALDFVGFDESGKKIAAGVEAANNVEAVVKKSMKEILGGQFARVEGEQLVQAMFDAGLPVETVIKNVERIQKRLQQAAMMKADGRDLEAIKSQLREDTREFQKLAADGGVSKESGAKQGPKRPKVGTESKGYRFKGGDPSKKENWEKI